VCTQKRELKSPLEIERVSSVRAIPRVRVALKRRRCQAAEVLEQLVKNCRMVSEAAGGWQVGQAGEGAIFR
jgi:hypothetical protein